MTLIHAVGMLLLFLGLLVLELFIPSGGLLGLAAVASLIAAIVIGFLHSFTAGALIFVGAVISGPILISFGLRIWPRTPVGRRMLTIDPEENARFEAEAKQERESLVGQVGIAKSNLLPSGLIELNGRRLDAVSVGMAIDKGQAVEVVSVTSGIIRVRPAEQTPAVEPTPAATTSLETPIESLEWDDWKS